MREYGKVYTAFWTSEDARRLSEDGRVLALYLMTCPHANMLGCFRLSDAYAGDDLQWKPERVRKGFDELFDKGFAYRCERSFFVIIRQYLKWNQFENPNVGKAAGKMFEALNAPHNLKAALALALRDFSPQFPRVILEKFMAKSEPFENPFDTLSKPYRKPEPEPEPEPGTRTPNTIVDLKADRAPQNDPVVGIFEYWQERMSSPRGALDKKRRRLIEKALVNYTPREICEAIRGCSMTPHNMGQNSNNTKYNGLDLILRDADHIDRFITTARAKPNGAPADKVQTEAEFLADVQAAVDRLNGANSGTFDPTIIDMEESHAQQ